MRISDWSSDVCSSDLSCRFILTMKGAKDRSIRSSVPPRREVNVQANGTDQKEIAEGLDAIDAAAFKAALSNASTTVTVVATDGPLGRAGLTCSAVSSVCDTPPTLPLFSPRRREERGEGKRE